MQNHHSWILATALALGGIALIGCENDNMSHSSDRDTNAPKSMSNVPSDQQSNTPDNPSNPDNKSNTPSDLNNKGSQDVQRFDANTRDSTTGNAGGGADDIDMDDIDSDL